MAEYILIGLTLVVVLGIAAQWLSWRLGLPAILLLLLFGFAAGPVTRAFLHESWVDPDAIFGQLLFPFISLSVAIILFEGGLSLRFGELGQIGQVVRNLISIGIAITWLGCTLAARYILGFPWPLALLCGAILIVTGPTVVGPLLRQVRPGAKLSSLLKWEGILNDPIGAVIAVLVFESILDILAGVHPDEETRHVLIGLGLTLFDGIVVGGLGAVALIVMLRKYWVPDFLQSPVTLAIVAIVFAGSNLLQAESGLLSVTVMGVILANQKWVSVRHIIEFKENLTVLLISVLFILLAARLQWSDIRQIGAGTFAFVAVVMFVVRPVAAWVSTIGSGFTWQERLFIGLIGPRGIVAAAVSALFAISLTDAGMEEAAALVPVVFLVIVGTIVFCSVAAGPIARWLKLSTVDPQGVLFIGAHEWARAIAEALHKLDVPVLLVDTNAGNVRAARMAGLPARKGSILDDELIEDLDTTNLARSLSLTPNDEANALAAVRMFELFDRKNVYQLAPYSETVKGQKSGGESHGLRGRFLFDDVASFHEIGRRFGFGAKVKATRLTETFGYAAFKERHGDSAIPLFLLNDAGKLTVWTAQAPPTPVAGQRIISLMSGEANGEEERMANPR